MREFSGDKYVDAIIRDDVSQIETLLDRGAVHPPMHKVAEINPALEERRHKDRIGELELSLINQRWKNLPLLKRGFDKGPIVKQGGALYFEKTGDPLSRKQLQYLDDSP